ncbi:MAG: tRNA (guanosine(37)-N1)-methyltransferase TrmD, partial [Elusimicrobia bacterium]|nr:tRNA (guanosine(37)-N1)-methyltransferase TrmD [Elusimicrobiota bacterium]
MRIDFVTLFPEMFAPVMDASILGRAREKGLLSWGCVNPRDFSEDKHRKVDDRPFGGGPGMVMLAEPLARAVESVREAGSRVVFLSPQGRRFDDAKASEMAKEKHLVLVCGHYEGVDERITALFDEELSI